MRDRDRRNRPRACAAIRAASSRFLQTGVSSDEAFRPTRERSIAADSAGVGRAGHVGVLQRTWPWASSKRAAALAQAPLEGEGSGSLLTVTRVPLDGAARVDRGANAKEPARKKLRNGRHDSSRGAFPDSPPGRTAPASIGACGKSRGPGLRREPMPPPASQRGEASPPTQHTPCPSLLPCACRSLSPSFAASLGAARRTSPSRVPTTRTGTISRR